MKNEPFYGDPCPLCRRPLRIEYGRSRPSAPEDRPARVWIAGYRCNDCETTRAQRWADAMRTLFET
ncbi:hypothetical protein [Streptomyces prunicolor]|uniref:Uncharacterized protein n=1 Tax=Streptomyces prunicolor TaxID=67348 RepID=A0ABU4FPW1_9ACTN|nr:hypothetical protein [Streptomyces prunicolor]MDV7222637.1 hypothetical protein [Streptomyces prunicolor]